MSKSAADSFNCHEIKFEKLNKKKLSIHSGRTSTSTGMASMMDEMAKTLARRRAQAEKKPDVSVILICFLPLPTLVRLLLSDY